MKFSRQLILRSLVALGLATPVLAENAPAPAPAPTATVQPAPPAAVSDGSNPGIATIDMKKIFEVHPKAKDAGEKIGAARDAVKKDLDVLLVKRKGLFEEIKKLDKSISGGKLAITAKEQADWLRKAKALDIEALDGKIREFQATHEKSLQDTWAKLQGGIVADIDKAIVAAPALNGFTLLFDKNGSTTNGLPFVIHANPDLDRSSPVQKQLAGEKPDSAGEPQPPSVAGVNLATLDVKKIFTGYYKTKEAEDAINAVRAKLKKEVDDRKAVSGRLESEIKAIDTALDGTTLTVPQKKAQARERSGKVDELKQLDKELRDIPAARELEAQTLSTNLKAAIVEDITKAMADAVKANGHVDLLVDAGGPSLNGIPVVLRRDGVPDWTDAVVAMLNSTKPDAKKPAGEPKTETVSTSSLRFAVIDMKRVFDASPAIQAADKALNDARAAANRADAAADAKNKVKDLETAAGRKRAEVLDQLAKLLAGREAKSSYQLVLDSSAKSLSGVPFVTAQNALPDLSEEMITALGGAKP